MQNKIELFIPGYGKRRIFHIIFLLFLRQFPALQFEFQSPGWAGQAPPAHNPQDILFSCLFLWVGGTKSIPGWLFLLWMGIFCGCLECAWSSRGTTLSSQGVIFHFNLPFFFTKYAETRIKILYKPQSVGPRGAFRDAGSISWWIIPKKSIIAAFLSSRSWRKVGNCCLCWKGRINGENINGKRNPWNNLPVRDSPGKTANSSPEEHQEGKQPGNK